MLGELRPVQARCLSAQARIGSSPIRCWRSLWIASEDLALELVDLAHRLQRVVQALLRLEVVAGRRTGTRLNTTCGRQLLDPGLQPRLEGVAVRAVVPEELDHLDLAGRRIDRRRACPAPGTRCRPWARAPGPAPGRQRREAARAKWRPAKNHDVSCEEFSCAADRARGIGARSSRRLRAGSDSDRSASALTRTSAVSRPPPSSRSFSRSASSFLLKGPARTR